MDFIFFSLIQNRGSVLFRAPHIIFGTLTSFFLYKIGSMISTKTGVFAAICILFLLFSFFLEVFNSTGWAFEFFCSRSNFLCNEDNFWKRKEKLFVVCVGLIPFSPFYPSINLTYLL